MRGVAAPTIAGCFGLAAFAVAIVAGMLSGNHTGVVMVRAIIALLVCYPIGFGVGLIAQRIIDEQVESHKQANPAPDVPDDAPGGAPANEDSSDEDVIVV
jgi:tetrahydromethanopterin S-methyltransferase subunit C